MGIKYHSVLVSVLWLKVLLVGFGGSRLRWIKAADEIPGPYIAMTADITGRNPKGCEIVSCLARACVCV